MVFSVKLHLGIIHYPYPLFLKPKNLRVETLPDPIGHFGAPCRPFWILKESWSCLEAMFQNSQFNLKVVLR